jgi:hypothetical protein
MLMCVKNWWYVGASAGGVFLGAPAMSAFGALCFGALFGPDDPPEHPATTIAVAAASTTNRLTFHVPRTADPLPGVSSAARVIVTRSSDLEVGPRT